ncbi:MAG: glycerol-3-phosphate dehydrogenase, partial [Rhizobiales bacterium]|nr:glycerol-3-phosphate dehydrogenase [Hyphomicrobiales bacterium]
CQPAVLRSLLHHYGAGLGDVLRHVEADPELAAPVGGSAVIGAQAVHAVRSEMAQTLGDVVFRRTDLATGSYPGDAALRQIAAAVAPMLGWSEAEITAQIEAVEGRFPKRAILAAGRAPAHDPAAA